MLSGFTPHPFISSQFRRSQFQLHVTRSSAQSWNLDVGQNEFLSGEYAEKVFPRSFQVNGVLFLAVVGPMTQFPWGLQARACTQLPEAPHVLSTWPPPSSSQSSVWDPGASDLWLLLLKNAWLVWAHPEQFPYLPVPPDSTLEFSLHNRFAAVPRLVFSEATRTWKSWAVYLGILLTIYFLQNTQSSQPTPA